MKRTQSFPFIGGENLSQPAMTLTAGELLGSQNYESVPTGGYRRIDGYERFDGQQSPSRSKYEVLLFVAGSSELNQGDVLTGDTSGAIATVVKPVIESGSLSGSDAVGRLCIVQRSGSFQEGESVSVGEVPVLTLDKVDTTSGNDLTDEDFRVSTVAYFRSLISAVPGSGPVRGVFYFNDVVYAFRDNEIADKCVMHKSTPQSWEMVETPELPPGGRYEFVRYNFTGAAGNSRIYGVSGATNAFEFDGENYVEIVTGTSVDTPKHVAVFRNHLFLAFQGGSLQYSPTADPTGDWVALANAGEIATGDEITGLMTLQGDSLAVFNRNRIYILQGRTPDTWNLSELSDESGAIPYSAQRIGGGMYLDDRGLNTLRAVDVIGDFNSATISQKINKTLVPKINSVVCSTRVKSRDQYLAFFENGSAISVTYSGETLIGITSWLFKHRPQVIYNGEDSTGTERVFFGDENGFIHELNAGTSMDGETIQGVLRLVFNNIGQGAYNLRFYKAVLEVEVFRSLSLQFSTELNYGDRSTPVSIGQTFNVSGGGGFFDFNNFEEILWDGQPVGTAEAYLNGIGKNLSLIIYTEEAHEQAHILQSAIIHYAPRGIQR